jgi:hypothetical protein
VKVEVKSWLFHLWEEIGDVCLFNFLLFQVQGGFLSGQLKEKVKCLYKD